MYGYSEGKEIALYMDAVSQLKQLIVLKQGLEAAVQSNVDLVDSTAMLLYQIRSIRNTLAIDGNTWESRPYDLLTIQNNDGAINSENVTSSSPFKRANDWEKLLAFFIFEDQFKRFIDAKAEKIRRKRITEKKKKEEYLPDVLTGLTQEDISAFLKEALKSLNQALTRLEPAPSHRLKYDIFDNAISYTERTARWQEYTASTDDNVICIPNSFCQSYRSILLKDIQMNTPHFFELLMFTTMLFKHLQRIGVTKDMLTGDDYWHIPGGMRGLGAYQRNCTAETFFSRVRKSIEFFHELSFDPPVRLIALNGEWMANMDASVFEAFSNAHMTYNQLDLENASCSIKKIEKEYVSPISCDSTSPFADYLDTLFPNPTFTEIRKYDHFFTLESDGSLSPSFTLSNEYGPAKSAPVKKLAVYQMLLDRSWKENDEQAWNEFWPSVESYLRNEAKEIVQQKTKKKSITLNWMKNANSLDKRASQIILGYLCSLEKQCLVFDIQKESGHIAAFCQAANRYLEKDSAEGFAAYYTDITNEQLKTFIQLIVEEKDDSTWSVGIRFDSNAVKEKKVSVSKTGFEPDASTLLLLKNFFSFNLKDKTPDELNALFFTAWNLWKENLPKFAMDPGSQLLAEKNTPQENLWSFCETVLLWFAGRNISDSKTCNFPEKPFDTPTDAAAFNLFCRHLSYQWFGWKLNAIDIAASPVQIKLSKRTKTPGLCENDDSAFSLVLDPGSNSDYPDESLLQSLFVKGFRCLLHRSYFTRDFRVPYAPERKPDKKQESRILYFLGSALLYFGFKKGCYACSWNPEQNTFTVDHKVLAFSAVQEASAEHFARYLLQEQFANSNRSYCLLCTPSEESGSEFTLSIM